jgi:hypothetical protein
MSRFYVHIPGWVYGMTAYGLNKKDAVLRFKKQHCMTRMPRGYKIWEAV